VRALRGAPSGKTTVIAMVLVGLLVLLGAAGLGWRSWKRAPYDEAVRLHAAEGPAAALPALARARARAGLEGPESELLALCRLHLGELDAAAEAFASAAAAGGAGEERPEALAAVAARLLAAGREDALPPLAAYAREVLDPVPPEVLAHEGFGKHAQADLEGARRAYRAALDSGLSGRLEERVERELGRAAEESRSGRVPVVLARGGSVLAWRDARSRALVAGPELEALLGGAPVESLPGLEAGDLDGRVELTLDVNLQRRAARVYRAETGAFVALSVPEGEVLAAVAELEPTVPLAPFDARYQPGSTLKVLTLAAWLDEGMPDDLLVPYHCKGNDFVIDGEIVYDWAAHGRLETFERALSQSCNTVFARMGLELGEQRLRDALRPLGFGASLEEGAGAGEGSGLPGAGGFSFGTGALSAGPLGERRLARTAMGLDETRVSPLQAAAMGLIFAAGGELSPPRLVRRRLNVVGEVLPGERESATPVRVFTAASARRVARAMETVVTDADGTGRGARVAGVPVALKTGTTGGDGDPLSSAFVGFLPTGSPEIAFGMFTRESGRSLDVSRRVLGPFLKDAWDARNPSARTN
jgi:hypothetical protein